MSQPFDLEVSNLLEIPVESLTHNYMVVGNHDWDSITQVSIIALIDKHFDKQINTSRLATCRTYGDILNLAKDG